ncbi:MAG: SsrA-binding protein SmpB [Saprospiraceae bacterium]|nr:SsrA-binding protein SmpB [Saprospiraceae bacterium]
MERDFTNFEIKNRKAKFEYIFIETYQAGIQLTGSEIKSLREGQANMGDAYCILQKGELFVRNLHISEYKQASENHEPTRTRKLLLKRSELKKLERKVSEKGFTIVPYRIYFAASGFAKIEIALAQGKKSFDKRESIKQKDQQRELERIDKYTH